MQRFARWTNLSETTFVLPPSRPERRLPGPHLHARRWSCRSPATRRSAPATPGSRPGDRRAAPTRPCRMRRRAGRDPPRRGRLAFAARPCSAPGRSTRRTVAAGRGRPRARPARTSLAVEWVDNGPGWVAVLLVTPSACWISARPGSVDLDLGVVGFHPRARRRRIEVRAFFPIAGSPPRTRSPAASTPPSPSGCSASGRHRALRRHPGSAIGRAGRVHVDGTTLGPSGSVGSCDAVIDGTASSRYASSPFDPNKSRRTNVSGQ